MATTRIQTSSDRLRVGGELIAPRSLSSLDGAYRLVMQEDGNLVIYNRTNKATWSTGTWNLPSGQRPVKAVLTRGGALVLLDASGVQRWSSRNVSPGVDHMILNTDGSLVIYAGRVPVWSSLGAATKPTIPRPTFPIPPRPTVPGPVADGQSRDAVINQYDRLAASVNETVKIADVPPTTVDGGGVPYQVTQQKFQMVRDVVEQSYLKDIASLGVWPGQVIQGNALKSGGVAAIGPFTRAPGTINISTELISTTPGVQHAVIAQPSASSVDQARRDILKSINATDAAGSLKATFEQASTLREVGANAGLNVSGSAFSVDANASLNQTYKQSTVVGVIRQVYYSVSFEPGAAGVNGFWPESVPMSDLSRYMGTGNPPLYISSVQYGRMICILAHGSYSSSEITAALKASYNSSVSGRVNADLRLKEVLSKSEVTIYTLGVTGKSNFQKLTSPVEELDDVFRNGLRFGAEHPGAPISFTAKHIADNTDAHVSLVAQYTKAVSAVGVDVPTTTFYVWDGKGGGQVDTGIEVNPSDVVTVKASGEIWSGVIFSGTHGPEGWAGHKPDRAAPLNSAGATAYSFIISFGNTGWIEAKSFWSGKPPVAPKSSSGKSSLRLLLGINDNNPLNGDPKKKWRVEVSVKRGSAESVGVFI